MFHTPDYVDYLEKVSGKNVAKLFEKEKKPNICKKIFPFLPTVKIGESFDCPIFQGVYQFSQISAGNLTLPRLTSRRQFRLCIVDE
jgi:acetoin utilization deacetylase AcuC-like enzyme